MATKNVKDLEIAAVDSADVVVAESPVVPEIPTTPQGNVTIEAKAPPKRVVVNPNDGELTTELDKREKLPVFPTTRGMVDRFSRTLMERAGEYAVRSASSIAEYRHLGLEVARQAYATKFGLDLDYGDTPLIVSYVVQGKGKNAGKIRERGWGGNTGLGFNGIMELRELSIAHRAIVAEATNPPDAGVEAIDIDE